MKNRRWIYHFLVAAFVHLSKHGCNTQSAYTAAVKATYDSTTWQYNPHIRPDTAVPVSVSFSVSNINQLNTATGQFSITGWFSISWADASFVWIPSSPNNIEYLFLKKDICWRPNLNIVNAVDDVAFLGDDDLQMRVKYDGTVLWEPGGIFTVKCSIDTANFPFDEQKCSLSLTSAVYDDSEVSLSHNLDKVTLIDLTDNTEWTISKTATEKSTYTDASTTFTKPLLKFTFKLKRESSFYVWTLLVPYIIISNFGVVAFIVPPVRGEKISLSLTVTLFVVIYFIIFSTLPALPEGKYPTIGIYFFLLLVVNILELLVTVIVERMHRDECEERPVSDNVQRVSGTLSRLSFYRGGEGGGGERNTDYKHQHHSTLRFPMPKNTRVSPASLQLANPVYGRPRKPDIDFDRIKSAASTRTTSDITMSTEDSNDSSTAPLQKTKTEYSWKDIAYMVDRIALAVFLFIVTTLTIVFIAILKSSI